MLARFRKGTKVLIIVIVIAFVGSLAYGYGSVSRGSVRPGAVMARVNGQEIREIEFAAEYTRQERAAAPYGGIKLYQLEQFRAGVLDTLIYREALAQAAAKEGVKVSSSEVQAEIDKDVKSAGSMDKLERALWSYGLTLDMYRRLVKTNLMIKKLQDKIASGVQVTDEEVKAEFEKASKNRADAKYEDEAPAIREALKAKKAQTALNDYFKKVMDGARVEILDERVQAYKAWKDKKYDQAIEIYKSLAQKNPKDATVLYALGFVYSAKKDQEAAIEQYEAAKALAPTEPYILIALGSAYLEKGDKDKAKAEFRTALDNVGSDFVVLYAIRNSLEKLGDQEGLKIVDDKLAALTKPAENQSNSAGGGSQQPSSSNSSGGK